MEQPWEGLRVKVKRINFHYLENVIRTEDIDNTEMTNTTNKCLISNTAKMVYPSLFKNI